LPEPIFNSVLIRTARQASFRRNLTPDLPATAVSHRFATRWKNDPHQFGETTIRREWTLASSSYRGSELYHSVTWKKRPLPESEVGLAQAIAPKLGSSLHDRLVRENAIHFHV
jgi:hypothetical protein